MTSYESCERFSACAYTSLAESLEVLREQLMRNTSRRTAVRHVVASVGRTHFVLFFLPINLLGSPYECRPAGGGTAATVSLLSFSAELLFSVWEGYFWDAEPEDWLRRNTHRDWQHHECFHFSVTVIAKSEKNVGKLDNVCLYFFAVAVRWDCFNLVDWTFYG